MYETFTDLAKVYKKDHSVTFISGDLGSGKTDLALLLMENGKAEGIFHKIATNVTTHNDPYIDFICYFDRLEAWLKSPGRKAYLLDELGINLYKMSFMSAKAKAILKVCQLVRKFNAHLFGIAPSFDFVNKMFSHVLDIHMIKLSLKSCLIDNKITHKVYSLENLPRTQIKFLTRDIAEFELKDPNFGKEKLDALSPEEKALTLYAIHHTTRKVATVMNVSAMQVSRLLKKAVAKRGYT